MRSTFPTPVSDQGLARFLAERVIEQRERRRLLVDAPDIGPLEVPRGLTTDPERVPALLRALETPEALAMYETYAAVIALQARGEDWSLSCLPAWQGMERVRSVGTLSMPTDEAFGVDLNIDTGRIAGWRMRVDRRLVPLALEDHLKDLGTTSSYLIGKSLDEFAQRLSNPAVIEAARSAVATTGDGVRRNAERHNFAFATYLGFSAAPADAPMSDGDLTWEVISKYDEVLTRVRRHQSAFRKNLLASREHPRCEVCRLDELAVLDAAHILPDSVGGPSSSTNAALLCANHHRAHDSALLSFDENRNVIWAQGVSPF